MPPPFDVDGGTFLVLFCAPASRYVYTSLEIHPEQAAAAGSGADDAWTTHLITKMQQALWLNRDRATREMDRFRPRLITARDPVVARALRRAGGMECPGTEVKVIGPGETVDGTPLIGIMVGVGVRAEPREGRCTKHFTAAFCFYGKKEVFFQPSVAAKS